MKYTIIVDSQKTCWYKEGTEIFHREDGPAIEYTNGDKFWCQNGKCHRLDGPAVEYDNGSKYWCQHGQYHRIDGPAWELVNGTKWWYQHGKCHRLDGPACEYANGTKLWYFDDKEYTEAEFLKKTQTAQHDGQIVEISGIKYKLTSFQS